MVKYFVENNYSRECMTRNGKIARLPAANREELNQRLLGVTSEENTQRIRRIPGLGEDYDCSKNPK
jgi:hypothetical protein